MNFLITYSRTRSIYVFLNGHGKRMFVSGIQRDLNVGHPTVRRKLPRAPTTTEHLLITKK